MKRITLILVTLALAVYGGSVSAQNFPERPVTLVNPYSAGGPTGLLARTIAAPMESILGQPLVVVSKPGAGSAIAATYVARSEPDGYTLFIGGSPTHAVIPKLRKDINYRGIEDFAPVGTVAIVPNALVVPADRPYETIEELVAYAKEADGSMTFASVGIGSLPQFLGVLLQQRADIELTHVPYKGGRPAVVDLVAGNVDMAFLNVPPVLGHVRSGKLRAIGVANGRRSAQLPDVPTMEQIGYPDFEMSTWYGISAPAGTPRPIIDKLYAAFEEALNMPEVYEKLNSQGAQVFLKGPDEFAEFLRKDTGRMHRLIAAAGLTAN